MELATVLGQTIKIDRRMGRGKGKDRAKMKRARARVRVQPKPVIIPKPATPKQNPFDLTALRRAPGEAG